MNDRARLILQNAGWFEDYYYILKVMNSCLLTQDPNRAFKQLVIATDWGLEQLDNKYMVLHLKYGVDIGYDIWLEIRGYINNIYYTKWNIMDKILLSKD